MLVFSEQDVLRDPPFSKLDLISCRNLLIYLGPDLQKQLIPLFHYALRSGWPALPGDLRERRRVHRSLRPAGPEDEPVPPPGGIPRSRPSGLRDPSGDPGRGPPRVGVPPQKAPDAAPIPLRRLTEAALLEETAAVAALVDEAGKILYLHGRTGLYLEPAPGDGEMNVLRMAREGLRRELSIAFHVPGPGRSGCTGTASR
jgi:two-component system, chemotaxis family, CheB/CheR fusion protein